MSEVVSRIHSFRGGSRTALPRPKATRKSVVTDTNSAPRRGCGGCGKKDVEAIAVASAEMMQARATE